MAVCDDCHKQSGSGCKECSGKDGEWVEMFVC